MIKAALIDAETPLGGEILRLLTHHPDVDLVGLVSPSNAGVDVTEIHHGLIGERPLRFRSDLPDKADAIFFCGNTTPDENIHARAAKGEVKIFDISRTSYTSGTGTCVPAISEIFRKPMVRGASECRILSPLETTLLIALFPLARNLMLSSQIEVEVETGEDVARDLDQVRAAELAQRLLHSIQQSFTDSVNIKVKKLPGNRRGLRLRTRLRLSIPVKDLAPLYDEVYDDHNFTFLLPRPRELHEVEGTNKCLICLQHVGESELDVEAIVDGRMRGWAGEAVLAMNLMFGLYEKTGLQLKASTY